MIRVSFADAVDWFRGALRLRDRGSVPRGRSGDAADSKGKLRYDLRKLKGHGLLQCDRSRYAYRLTPKRRPGRGRDAPASAVDPKLPSAP